MTVICSILAVALVACLWRIRTLSRKIRFYDGLLQDAYLERSGYLDELREADNSDWGPLDPPECFDSACDEDWGESTPSKEEDEGELGEYYSGLDESINYEGRVK